MVRSYKKKWHAWAMWLDGIRPLHKRVRDNIEGAYRATARKEITAAMNEFEDAVAECSCAPTDIAKCIICGSQNQEVTT